MEPMRAMFVLATLLTFATPSVSWTAMELSRDTSGSISLAAPFTGSQIVRAAVVKTDKVFGSSCAIANDRPAFIPQFASIECSEVRSTDPPNLDFNNPPLAPRPPPPLL
jgi:hypothetical protein